MHTNTGSPPTVQKTSVSGIWKRSLHAAADAHETLLKLRNDAGAVKEQVVDAAAHISLLKSEEMQEDKYVYVNTWRRRYCSWCWCRRSTLIQ